MFWVWKISIQCVFPKFWREKIREKRKESEKEREREKEKEKERERERVRHGRPFWDVSDLFWVGAVSNICLKRIFFDFRYVCVIKHFFLRSDSEKRESAIFFIGHL